MHSALVSTPPKCWECVIRNRHLCWSTDQSWGRSHMNPWIFTWWLTNRLPPRAVLVPIPLRPVSSHRWCSSGGSLATADLMTGNVTCRRYRGLRFRLPRRVPGCKCQEVTQNPSSGSLGGDKQRSDWSGKCDDKHRKGECVSVRRW